MINPVDILAFGMVTIDTFHEVDAYPPENTRTRIQNRSRHVVGNAACAMAAAARLGATAGLIGRLGTDEYSQFVRRQLTECQVDQSRIAEHTDCGPTLADVIVSRQTGSRTILTDHSGTRPLEPDEIKADWFDGVKVLLLDHAQLDTAVRAAELARQRGIPVVTDVEQVGDSLEALRALSGHFICGEDFAKRYTGCPDAITAVRELRKHPMHRVVAVTAGSDGCYWSEANDGRVWHQPACTVDAVNTTGCGDVFRGVYCYGLAAGWDLQRRMIWSTMAAGHMATQNGDWSALPTLKDLAKTLRDAPPPLKQIVWE
jgi:ribokinase